MVYYMDMEKTAINSLSRREFARLCTAAGLCAGCGITTGCAEKGPDIAVKIAVIGGGAAGISVAARLRRLLPKAILTIIDPAERHFYQPGFTFIAAGVWKSDDVWMPQEKLIPSGVSWKKTSVVAVEADHNTIVLANGERQQYDFLVLSPGLQENWSLIEGITKETLGAGNAHSIYNFEDSARTCAAIDEFLKNGGRGLFTDTWTKLKCGGAPKKICLLAEELARQTGRRKDVRFDYLTASKALYNVPHYTPRLLEIYKERNIPIRCNAKLTGVDVQARRAHFLDRETNKTFTEDYDFLHFAPPQSAPDFVQKSGLGWTEGKLAPEAWAMADKSTLLHLTYKNIVCVGDVAGIPTSKTTAAIRKQAPVAARNLCDLVAGKPPSAVYDGYAACPIITDRGHVLMAEFDYDKKPATSFPFTLQDTSKELRSAWLLKKYVLKPFYFNLMLKGIA